MENMKAGYWLLEMDVLHIIVKTGPYSPEPEVVTYIQCSPQVHQEYPKLFCYPTYGQVCIIAWVNSELQNTRSFHVQDSLPDSALPITLKTSDIKF